MLRYLQAFPDLAVTAEMLVQAPRAALIWTAHGTHRGSLLHIPASERTVEVRSVAILTVE